MSLGRIRNLNEVEFWRDLCDGIETAGDIGGLISKNSRYGHGQDFYGNDGACSIVIFREDETECGTCDGIYDCIQTGI